MSSMPPRSVRARASTAGSGESPGGQVTGAHQVAAWTHLLDVPTGQVVRASQVSVRQQHDAAGVVDIGPEQVERGADLMPLDVRQRVPVAANGVPGGHQVRMALHHREVHQLGLRDEDVDQLLDRVLPGQLVIPDLVRDLGRRRQGGPRDAHGTGPDAVQVHLALLLDATGERFCQPGQVVRYRLLVETAAQVRRSAGRVTPGHGVTRQRLGRAPWGRPPGASTGVGRNSGERREPKRLVESAVQPLRQPGRTGGHDAGLGAGSPQMHGAGVEPRLDGLGLAGPAQEQHRPAAALTTGFSEGVVGPSRGRGIVVRGLSGRPRHRFRHVTRDLHPQPVVLLPRPRPARRCVVDRHRHG